MGLLFPSSSSQPIGCLSYILNTSNYWNNCLVHIVKWPFSYLFLLIVPHCSPLNTSRFYSVNVHHYFDIIFLHVPFVSHEPCEASALSGKAALQPNASEMSCPRLQQVCSHSRKQSAGAPEAHKQNHLSGAKNVYCFYGTSILLMAEFALYI